LEAQNAALVSALEEANRKAEADAKFRGTARSDVAQRAADKKRVRVGFLLLLLLFLFLFLLLLFMLLFAWRLLLTLCR
jgi:hypothetical protein